MGFDTVASASASSPFFLGRSPLLLQQQMQSRQGQAPGRHMATAAAAAAAGSGPGAGTGTGASAAPAVAAAGPRRLSPEADVFQKHWYGEVNTGPVSGSGGGRGALAAPSADEQAAAYAKHSQAVRLLVGWLRERRACPPDSEARRTYDIDGRLANRAMQVIRDLEYARPDKRRPWRQRGRPGEGAAAAAAAPATGGSGHLSLDEMIEAVETLAADAPSMGFTLSDRHFELLLDLYVQRAEGEGEGAQGTFRAGLAARAAAVQQQMALQLVQVSPTALGALLTCLNLDVGSGGGARAMSAAEKLAAGVRLVDLYLRPASNPAAAAAAAASGPGAGVLAAPRLRERLDDLMAAALEQRNWAAYGKLRAVVLTYTRQPPSRRVLAAALSAAAATNEQALDSAEAAAEPEAAELGGGGAAAAAAAGGGRWLAAAREQAAAALEQMAERHKHEPDYAPVPLPAAPQHLQQQQQQGPAATAYRRRLAAARWRAQEAKAAEEALLEAEESGLVAVLRAAAAAGDDALADRAYDRLRWTAARRLQLAAAAAAAAAGEEGAAAATATAVRPAATQAAIPPSATLAVLGLAAARGDYRRAVGLVAGLAELDQARKRYAGERAPAAQQLARRVAKDRAAMEAAVSAYGGLGPLSEQLISSEAATVAYYSELLRHVADAAAGGGAAAPFAGSAVPFGPPLRAAAARRDLTSVAGLIKQMRELGCTPTADSYAAVIDASYRSGKPERVPGLLALMSEEGLSPSAAVWELQLRAAAEAPPSDPSGGLAAVVQRALAEAAPEREGARGVVAISGKVLEELRSLAQVRGDGRAADLLGSLLAAQEEVRRAWRQAKKVAAWQAAGAREAAREQRRREWRRREEPQGDGSGDRQQGRQAQE